MKMLCMQYAEFREDGMKRPFFVILFMKFWLANGNFLIS